LKFGLIGSGIETFEPIVKGWVDILAFVDQTIRPNERDAVLTSRSAVPIGTGHQMEDAFVIGSSDGAKRVFFGTLRVECNTQILGWLSVYQHFALDGVERWLCRCEAFLPQE